MFLLSDAHYPTSTQIDAITIKSAHTDLDSTEAKIEEARVRQSDRSDEFNEVQ